MCSSTSTTNTTDRDLKHLKHRMHRRATAALPRAALASLWPWTGVSPAGRLERRYARLEAPGRLYQRARPAGVPLHMLAAGGLLVAGLALNDDPQCEEAGDKKEEKEKREPGQRDPALPTFSLEEVQAHTGARKNGTWVVYRHGVYDITRFIAAHPGGTKILLAAGSSIEPFWQLYAAHNHADVHEILERLRIGNLREEDVATLERLRKERYGDGPYSRDPQRHPALKVNSSMPFNAEPPPELLMESFITPNDLFFVRNHLPVPDVDADTYRLKISGIGIGKGGLERG